MKGWVDETKRPVSTEEARYIVKQLTDKFDRSYKKDMSDKAKSKKKASKQARKGNRK